MKWFITPYIPWQFGVRLEFGFQVLGRESRVRISRGPNISFIFSFVLYFFVVCSDIRGKFGVFLGGSYGVCKKKEAKRRE